MQYKSNFKAYDKDSFLETIYRLIETLLVFVYNCR